MIRPQRVLIDCYLDDARAAVRTLREQGWPVEIQVDYVPESRGYTVTLRFDLPYMPIPIEALAGEDAPLPEPFGKCGNGDDEECPCDPKANGDGTATCSVCGWTGAIPAGTYDELVGALRSYWQNADREQALGDRRPRVSLVEIAESVAARADRYEKAHTEAVEALRVLLEWAEKDRGGGYPEETRSEEWYLHRDFARKALARAALAGEDA